MPATHVDAALGRLIVSIVGKEGQTCVAGKASLPFFRPGGVKRKADVIVLNSGRVPPCRIVRGPTSRGLKKCSIKPHEGPNELP